MTPTMELRFVERDVLTGSDGWTTVRVLQQKWSHTGVGGITGYVWRDVECVKEEE